jgi:hypothetical protein
VLCVCWWPVFCLPMFLQSMTVVQQEKLRLEHDCCGKASRFERLLACTLVRVPNPTKGAGLQAECTDISAEHACSVSVCRLGSKCMRMQGCCTCITLNGVHVRALLLLLHVPVLLCSASPVRFMFQRVLCELNLECRAIKAVNEQARVRIGTEHSHSKHTVGHLLAVGIITSLRWGKEAPCWIMCVYFGNKRFGQKQASGQSAWSRQHKHNVSHALQNFGPNEFTALASASQRHHVVMYLCRRGRDHSYLAAWLISQAPRHAKCFLQQNNSWT